MQAVTRTTNFATMALLMGLLYIYKSLLYFSTQKNMGPSYVHQLLWDLTPVHEIVLIYSFICTTIMGPSYIH